jgi:hypothetical protein
VNIGTLAGGLQWPERQAPTRSEKVGFIRIVIHAAQSDSEIAPIRFAAIDCREDGSNGILDDLCGTGIFSRINAVCNAGYSVRSAIVTGRPSYQLCARLRAAPPVGGSRTLKRHI